MSDFEVVERAEQPTAVVRGSAPMDQLKEIFDRGFGAVFAAIGKQGVPPAGPPIGFYPTPPSEGRVEVEVGVPVASPISADGDVVPSSIPGGRIVRGVHEGSYDDLANTYSELRDWAAGEDLTLGMSMWECYLTDPSAEPDPTKWQTEICWLVAD